MRRDPPLLLVLLAVLLAAAPCPALAAGEAAPTPAEIARIAEAIPRAAPARPAAARRVLLFTRTIGYRHASIPHGVEAFTRMGAATGAYAAEHSEDPERFAPERLAAYDAVVLLNALGPILRPGTAKQPDAVALRREAELRASLRSWLEAGKGLAVIHAGVYTHPESSDFVAMIGGAWASHPWHQKVPIVVERPEHPCNRCFAERRFELHDEIYEFKAPWPEPHLALLRLDPDWPGLAKGRRGDKDYPLAWLKPCGKGRVFVSTLGHAPEAYWNPLLLAHWLAGLQLAIGDLAGEVVAPQAAAPAR